MLSEKEKEGCRRFLQDFQQHELLSLVETVTNRMITVQNKNDAINAIILHSETAHEFLRRRKVKKEYIFRHLAAESVCTSPTSDKETLIRQLLSLWGTTLSEPEEWTQTLSDDQEGEYPKHSPTAPAEPPAQRSPHVQLLAQQFASWFYQRLNSVGQALPNPATRDWGPHHFWGDAKLNLCISSSDKRVEAFEGAELVAQRFQSFVLEEGLIFNPNIDPEGTRGWEDPHGLVGVGVCGTVHRGDECLGLFEQQFGLIRDPLRENNWKIKFVNMELRQAAVQQMPTLKAPLDVSQHVAVM